MTTTQWLDTPTAAQLNPPMNATTAQFSLDAVSGLSHSPKTLPCKWFYDDRGSTLFEQITTTPEYYLTRAESRILGAHLAEIVERLADVDVMIEPGSGSSAKTRQLLAALPALDTYRPIDISAEFLIRSAAALREAFAGLTVDPLVADFTALTEPLVRASDRHPLVFFPGSTIGNFAPDDAVALLASLRKAAGARARLLIGVDMTQDESLLLPAYDDAAGITAAFNRNILVRAVRELGADVSVDRFAHRAVFNRSEQRVEMHLVSTCAQSISLCGRRFEFAAGESIHTENSHKYPKARFIDMLASAGWRYEQMWRDDGPNAFSLLLLR